MTPNTPVQIFKLHVQGSKANIHLRVGGSDLTDTLEKPSNARKLGDWLMLKGVASQYFRSDTGAPNSGSPIQLNFGNLPKSAQQMILSRLK